MKELLNKKGQVLPFIAFMIVIIILFAAFSVATTMMFMQRKVIEDALDAAILSVSMASVVEKSRPVYYYDYLDKVCAREIIISTPFGSFSVCVAYEYYVRESDAYPRNYIYVKSSANDIMEEAFLRNLERNAPLAKVENIKLEVEYDDERFLTVKKRKNYLDPPSTWGGWPLIGRSSNPDAWWLSEFSRSTDFLGKPEAFTEQAIEERKVRFPRWVKLTATAEVEVPTVLGGIFSQDSKTVKITTKASAVRELKRIDRPIW